MDPDPQQNYYVKHVCACMKCLVYASKNKYVWRICMQVVRKGVTDQTVLMCLMIHLFPHSEVPTLQYIHTPFLLIPVWSTLISASARLLFSGAVTLSAVKRSRRFVKNINVYLFYFINFKKYHHYHVEFSNIRCSAVVFLRSHNTVSESYVAQFVKSVVT
jgi:hypothetical protein